MLGFIIDSYAWLDKIYRWTHGALAVLTPILVIAQTTMYNNDDVSKNDSDVSGTLASIFGFIVAGMLKLKDYVTYDKIRDTAKMQTIKYQQLFERIENELLKPEDKRQSESDFIYWLGREFQHIEVNDPDMTNSEKKKFIQLCKEKNIPYDEDIEMLDKLTHSQVDIIVEKPPSPSPDIQSGLPPDIQPIPPPNLPRKSSKRNITFDETKIQTNIQSPDVNKSQSSIITRTRSVSEEEERKKYKDSLKNINTEADLKWTIERLNNLG